MSITELDPFDLPDWLGERDVTWRALEESAGRIAGRFEADDLRFEADLLACDRAYPTAVLPEQWRTVVHRAWKHGQVTLLDLDDRVVLGVPGVDLVADTCLVAIGRFASAIGSGPRRFSVALRAY